MATNNAINLSAAGVVSYNGSGTFTGSAITQYTTLVGGASNAIVGVGPGTVAFPLVSAGAGANPAYALLTVPGGGSGAATFTAHSLLLGQGTSAMTALGAATNGQIPIGSTGADPVLATITAGAGISVGVGAGSITISATGAGFAWSTITSATQAISVENGYVANRSGGVAFSLPATAAVGDQFRIMGLASGTGWSITQGAGQLIQLGSSVTTTGAGGSLASTNAGDSVLVTCIVTNTTWSVADVIGNLTVV